MERCITVNCQNEVSPESRKGFCQKCIDDEELKIVRLPNEIENIFKYHAPKEGQPEKYEAIRNKAKEFAYMIGELCPDSREKSIAMTNLEQVSMWANAAIARN